MEKLKESKVYIESGYGKPSTIYRSCGVLRDVIRCEDSPSQANKPVVECKFYCAANETFVPKFFKKFDMFEIEKARFEQHCWGVTKDGTDPAQCKYEFYTDAAWRQLEPVPSDVFSVSLNLAVYKEPTFPQIVEFTRGAKGLPCARIKAYPNVEGLSSNGKLYFPDKSWADTAKVGRAEVSIKMETAKYGFLFGKMLPTIPATLDELLNHWWSLSSLDGGSYVSRTTYEGMHLYFTEDSNDWMIAQCFLRGESGVISSPLVLSSEQREEGRKNRCTINDLFVKNAFGDVEAVDKVLLSFRMSEFRRPGVSYIHGGKLPPYRLQTRDWEFVEDIPGSDNLKKALRDGLFQAWQLTGYKIMHIEPVPENFFLFTEFTLDEIYDFVAEARKINEDADAETKRCLSKGTLRLAE